MASALVGVLFLLSFHGATISIGAVSTVRPAAFPLLGVGSVGHRRHGEAFSVKAAQCERVHGAGVCPVCGGCVPRERWKAKKMHGTNRSRSDALCPHCFAFERHRVAALVERTVPAIFPDWHSRKFIHALQERQAAMNSSSASSALQKRLRTHRRARQPPKVAYFGPHYMHERMLRESGVDVQGLDYFALGYKYDKTRTLKADLSGKSCGGGASINPEDCVPLADNSVDGVIILHVLEHVLPIKPALDQLARIAKPNAWMQVEVPCEPLMTTHRCRNEDKGPRLQDTSEVCAQTDHLVSYNCEDFKLMIESSGWSCVTSWESMGWPDEWIMNKHGLYTSQLTSLKTSGDDWVKDHAKRQWVCTRDT